MILLLLDQWFDTIPPDGTYSGRVYWVQDYRQMWYWEPVQEVGMVTFTLSGDTVTGRMDLPRDSVMWWERVSYPVRFYNEPTPREWREYEQYPWLFRVSQAGTSAPLRAGWRGRYTPWNFHVDWLYGESALGQPPTTGLSFRWRYTDAGVEVKAYGFWGAFPSYHYMSLGWETNSSG